jgi:putative endonuclease
MSLSKGISAEDHACTFLQQKGLAIVARNFRSKRGEIDIIARDGDTLAFIEVRLRTHLGYANAQESVNKTKQMRIIHTAEYFLMRFPHWQNANMRFDVVSFSQLNVEPEWLRSAFDFS